MDSEFLIKEIQRLKKEKNAVILAHNYQRGEVQDIADFVGDSLELSKEAAKTNFSVIIFAGVYFMAETASILSPKKDVLLTRYDAGCIMADSIEEEELIEAKEKYKNAPVLCYINSTAKIKALSDICVTSSNAVKIAQSIKEEEIIFIPDQGLGGFVAERTNKKVHIIGGNCPWHFYLTAEEVLKAKNAHKDALLLIHPEASKITRDMSDFIGSTSQMIKYVKESTHKDFIIGTEEGILHRLKKENKDRNFYLLSPRLLCPNMKKTHLEDVYYSLKEHKYLVKVEEEISAKAKKALDKMLEF